MPMFNQCGSLSDRFFIMNNKKQQNLPGNLENCAKTPDDSSSQYFEIT